MAKIGIQIWQIDADYERPDYDIPGNDQELPMSFALLKSNWSKFPMSTVDRRGVSSPQHLKEIAANVFAVQGIGVIPWGEAKALSLDDAKIEGNVSGRMAAAVGKVFVLDLESDPKWYWNAGPGRVQAWKQGFIDGYRAQSGRSDLPELWVQPDARPGHTTGIQLDEWLKPSPLPVSRWLPQTYPDAFYPDAPAGSWRTTRAIEVSVQELIARGVPKSSIHPTFTGSMLPEDWDAGLQILRDEGYGGVWLYRRGSMRTDVMAYLNALPQSKIPGYKAPTPPAPPKEPEPEPPKEPTGPEVPPFPGSARETEMLQHALRAAELSHTAIKNVLLQRLPEEE